MEIGPQLPPHLSRKKSDESSERGSTNDYDADEFGPILPPSFKSKSSTIIGPCKPGPEIRDLVEKEKRPSWEIDEDDTDGTEIDIGPQLPTQKDKDEYLNKKREEIEARAKTQKDELSDKKNKMLKKTEREEWMTELPPELGKNFGLGARTFRTKAVDLGDRSVWTDTPSDKAKKQNSAGLKSTEQREKTKKEIETEEYVSKHNKRFRGESLLDKHRQDQKKKKENEGGSVKERRPFDRETDLGLRQMDAAKKRTLIKQSSKLNSKFQHSKEGPAYL